MPKKFAIVTAVSSGIGNVDDVRHVIDTNVTGVLAEQHRRMTEPRSGQNKN